MKAHEAMQTVSFWILCIITTIRCAIDDYDYDNGHRFCY